MRHIRRKAKWVAAGIIGLLFPCIGPASAQLMPIPDDTLGAESSTVRPIPADFPVDVVEGGARVGDTLLHSFKEFHVGEGRALYFSDPGVNNIFSRVTGGVESQILGLLGVFGDADLFILNPDGIIFGERARLDLRGGSLLATTADFPQFSVTNIGSSTEPLLTVQPSAFMFSSENPAAIVNNARTLPPTGLDSAPRGGLRVADGERITLLGGDVSMDNGGISALGGQIQIGGLSEPGMVTVDAAGRLGFPTGVRRSNVVITNGSRLSASDFTVSGGSVTITANDLDITNGSGVSAGTVGEFELLEGQSGDIALEASRIRLVRSTIDNIVRAGRSDGGDLLITANELSISDRSVLQSTLLGEGRAGRVKVAVRDRATVDDSLIFSNLGGSDRTIIATGNAGNIEITVPVLLLTNGAQLQADTLGRGNAGNIVIDAPESISIESNSSILSNVSINNFGNAAVGDGGSIEITTPFLSLTGTSRLSSRTSGQGNGGDIEVMVGALSLTDGALFSTSSSGQGNAGNVAIEASDRAIFDRGNIFSNLDGLPESAVPTADMDNIRKAGDIRITTGSLDLINGSQFQSSTGARGNAGNITLQARDRISIEGVDPVAPSFASSIFAVTRAGAEGRGGDVNMTADSIRIANNGLVSTTTANRFSGGNVTARANTLELTGGGRILTATRGDGQAGDINLDITDRTVLTGSNTFGSENSPPFFSGLFADAARSSAGSGGTVRLSTSALQVLDQARIEVNSQGSGTAGDMRITADTLQLDNGRLTAETAAVNGGNIALDGIELLSLRNNSLISTTAGIDGAGGNGGNIDIEAEIILAVPSENSDIRANAFSGSGGRVRINTLGLFGIAPRSLDSPLTSDITASSQQGIQGTVDIALPETDPENSLTELPTTFANVSNQITQTCSGNGDGQDSEFVITGRGGLPPSPTDTLIGDTPLTDWAVLDESTETASREITHRETTASQAITAPTLSLNAEIVEAQAWTRENGSVKLLAAAPTSVSQSAVACQ